MAFSDDEIFALRFAGALDEKGNLTKDLQKKGWEGLKGDAYVRARKEQARIKKLQEGLAKETAEYKKLNAQLVRLMGAENLYGPNAPIGRSVNIAAELEKSIKNSGMYAGSWYEEADKHMLEKAKKERIQKEAELAKAKKEIEAERAEMRRKSSIVAWRGSSESELNALVPTATSMKKFQVDEHGHVRRATASSTTTPKPAAPVKRRGTKTAAEKAAETAEKKAVEDAMKEVAQADAARQAEQARVANKAAKRLARDEEKKAKDAAKAARRIKNKAHKEEKRLQKEADARAREQSAKEAKAAQAAATQEAQKRAAQRKDELEQIAKDAEKERVRNAKKAANPYKRSNLGAKIYAGRLAEAKSVGAEIGAATVKPLTPIEALAQQIMSGPVGGANPVGGKLVTTAKVDKMRPKYRRYPITPILNYMTSGRAGRSPFTISQKAIGQAANDNIIPKEVSVAPQKYRRYPLSAIVNYATGGRSGKSPFSVSATAIGTAANDNVPVGVYNNAFTTGQTPNTPNFNPNSAVFHRTQRQASSFGVHTDDELWARAVDYFKRYPGIMTNEQKDRFLTKLEAVLTTGVDGRGRDERAASRMVDSLESRVERMQQTRLKDRIGKRKKNYRYFSALTSIPGEPTRLTNVSEKVRFAENIISNLPAHQWPMARMAMDSAKHAYKRGDITSLEPTANRIIEWANANKKVEEGRASMVGLRHAGAQPWMYGSIDEVYAYAQQTLGSLRLPPEDANRRAATLTKEYDNAVRTGNTNGLKREAQRIVNDADREKSKSTRESKELGAAKHRARMRSMLKPMKVGQTGSFGDTWELLNRAEAAVKAFGGSDTARLLSDIAYMRSLHQSDQTLALGPIRAILKEMEAKRGLADAKSAIMPYRAYGGLYHYLNPTDAYALAQNALTGLPNAQQSQAALDRAKGELDKTGNIRGFGHAVERILNDAGRDQRIRARSELSATNAVRFLGVERVIDPTDKDAMHMAIKDFESFTKFLPGGQQFKTDIEAFRRLNNALGTTDADLPYRQELMTRVLKAQTRASNMAPARTWYEYRRGRKDFSTKDEWAAYDIAQQYAQLQDVKRTNFSYRMKSLKNAFATIGGNLIPINPFLTHDYQDKTGYTHTTRASWLHAAASPDTVYLGRKSFATEFARRKSDIKYAFSTIKDTIGQMLAENPAQLRSAIWGVALQAAKMYATGALIGSGIALGVGLGAQTSIIRSGMGVAEQRTKLRNMYNTSIPNSWKGGKSYEEFERESFETARLMRSDAYLQQENMMRLAMATGAARYVTGPNAGKPIVTSLDQVGRISRVLTLMAKVSGADNATLEGWALQLQQAIGKGAADIMDIKPMENRSVAMTNLWARMAMGLEGGAPELFRVMDAARGKSRTEGVTPEKFLPRMMDPETENTLLDMLHHTARSWEDVFAVVKSDIKQGALGFTSRISEGSGGDLGSTLLGMSQAIAQDSIGPYGTLSDLLNQLIPSGDALVETINDVIHKAGQLLEVGAAFLQAGAIVTGGLVKLAGAIHLIINLAQSIPLLVHGALRWAITGNENPKEFQLLRGSWSSWSNTSYQDIGDKITSMGLEYANGMLKFGRNLEQTNVHPRKIDNAPGDDSKNIEALTGATGEIAKDTKEIKKNGAKLTSIQLELLKQVSGRAIVNNVTRVAPNIVANVGTIKSGVEYEQFMADLNKTVRLAAMNMAY